jgi:demethylmenaquinone methyltransferase/2-methoxy-6-polyprenyl-1,4-benzoquinol methylase
MSPEAAGPPRRVRLVGRGVNAAASRAPWLWPLLRGPVRSYFDRLAPGWDGRTGAGSVDHLGALARAVSHLDRPPERVLDVGTGTGEAALYLAREYPSAGVRGIDISEEMVRAARHKVGLDPEGRVAFRVADAAALPYGEESFDLVAGVNVPPFFREFARVLRPDGHVILVATRGPATPFYTPGRVLERGFARHGVEALASGQVGAGTYWVGRRRAHAPL